jgi:hypothetical protein
VTFRWHTSIALAEYASKTGNTADYRSFGKLRDVRQTSTKCNATPLVLAFHLANFRESDAHGNLSVSVVQRPSLKSSIFKSPTLCDARLYVAGTARPRSVRAEGSVISLQQLVRRASAVLSQHAPRLLHA